MLVLTVLGCDGSHAGPGGAGSGYLVRSWSSRTSIWLDAGPGSLANLQLFCDPLSLSAIVLTHEHVDHWHDIFGYLTMARWTLGFERPPLPVIAAPGIRELVNEEIEGILEWREVGDGDGADIGGMRLRFSRTDHGPMTLGVRIESDGRTLGYSADSGPSWSLGSLGKDLDLALCEATYTSEFEGNGIGHMSGRQAGVNATEASARRLVITHRWSHIDAHAVLEEARAAFGSDVTAAAVGRGFSI